MDNAHVLKYNNYFNILAVGLEHVNDHNNDDNNNKNNNMNKGSFHTCLHFILF